MVFTKDTAEDCLILAIARQLKVNRRLCSETPDWMTWVVPAELRIATEDGLVRWQPSSWLGLSGHLRNIAASKIRSLEERGQVITICYTKSRIYWCGLTDTGVGRLEELDPKLAERLRRPVATNIES